MSSAVVIRPGMAPTGSSRHEPAGRCMIDDVSLGVVAYLHASHRPRTVIGDVQPLATVEVDLDVDHPTLCRGQVADSVALVAEHLHMPSHHCMSRRLHARLNTVTHMHAGCTGCKPPAHVPVQHACIIDTSWYKIM